MKIYGKFPAVKIGPQYEHNKIISIEQWGDVVRKDMAYIKKSGIKINATDTPVTKKKPNFK